MGRAYSEANNVLYLTPRSGRGAYLEHEENRVHTRYTCPLSVRLANQSSVMPLIDFSSGGLRTLSDYYLDGATVFDVQLVSTAQDHSVSLRGKVIWQSKSRSHVDKWEIGIQFVDFTSHDQVILQYLFWHVQGTEKYAPLFKPFTLIKDERVLSDLVSKINEHTLNPFILDHYERCNQIAERPLFLWKWCHEGLRRTTLSSIDSPWAEMLINVKLLSIIFFTAIDDTADEMQNPDLVRAATSVPLDLVPAFGKRKKNCAKPVAILRQIWQFISTSIKMFPRYSEFKDLFEYDYSELMQSVRYALLINLHPNCINEAEETIHQSYGLHVMMNATFDLMCSSKFDMRELGLLRETVLSAQLMCRIANWVATWEREVVSKDFTSGVIAAALRANIITAQELKACEDPVELTARIKDSHIEGKLLVEWERYWHVIEKNSHSISSVDLSAYLKGIETFYQMQIASQKLI